jgi:hypothetical protein
MSAIVIPNNRLRDILFDFGIDTNSAAVVLADVNYALPTQAWPGGEFSTRFKFVMVDHFLGPFESEVTDCDDFVEACSFYAHYCYRRTEGRPLLTQLAVAQFYFTRRDGEKHAINMFVCWDPSITSYVPVFYEPQTQRIIKLTKEEINSCTDCIFT